MSKRTPEQKAEFAEKLAYWRKNGCPGIIRDEAAQPIVSMADGKTYDSKSQYRKALKEKGFVELGDEKPEKEKPLISKTEDIVADVKKTAAKMGVSLG